MNDTYDLIVIGAGSGGLVAARFAAKLGAKVALVERNRIGGDCTWTGCVPSKALIKAAKVAYEARTAAHYGIQTGPPTVDMGKVREYVRQAIAAVYQYETAEQLTHEGVEVVMGAASFLDMHTIQAGDRTLSAKHFLITSGARPVIPSITGLRDVAFLTYEQLFDNDRLPASLIVMGAGPIGMEMAQAYQRLGAQVTVVSERLLPKDEPEVAEVMRQVFVRDGLQFVWSRATAVRQEGAEIVVSVKEQEVRGDMLLVAVGRAPNGMGWIWTELA